MTDALSQATTSEAAHGYDQRLLRLIDDAGIDPSYRLAAETAPELYNDKLPYHNKEHMFEVTEAVLKLCDEHGIKPYNRQAVCIAALWHDADYGVPLANRDSDATKEQRSALLAHQAIMDSFTYTAPDLSSLTTEKYQEAEAFAEDVASLIISTTEGRQPRNELELILNLADLMNLEGNSREMLRRTGAYYVEGLQLEGREVAATIEQVIIRHADEFEVWCANTQTTLTKLSQAKLGGSITRMVSWAAGIPTEVQKNIARITPETVLSAVRGEDSTEDYGS